MKKAFYDNDGNIILEGSHESFRQEKSDKTFTHDIFAETREATWTVIAESSEKQMKVKKEKSLLRASMQECATQYADTAQDAKINARDIMKELRDIPRRLHRYQRNFWNLALTPVSLRGIKSTKKHPTKLGLFVTDTVRFGGTFALIFAVLFAGVNYESFFQISRSVLAFGNDIGTEEALMKMTNSSESSPSINTTSTVNVLAYLPPVGPYEDRLIIPKLGENVPIVRPPMTALMDKNWSQFESDIQESLRDGVVHYPGSARPGQAGNFFVTGHSSYYPWDDGKYKSVFARLQELNIGDTYFVYYGGDRHSYRVTEKYEVKPNNVSVLDQPSNKRIATLMTCTPVGTTLRRLIVRAEEFDPVSGKALLPGQKSDEILPASFARLDALPI